MIITYAERGYVCAYELSNFNIYMYLTQSTKDPHLSVLCMLGE